LGDGMMSMYVRKSRSSFKNMNIRKLDTEVLTSGRGDSAL